MSMNFSIRRVGVCLLLLASPACAPAQEPEGDSRLVQLGKRYGLDIVPSKPTFPVKTHHGLIDGKGADPKDSDSFGAILVAEWSCYPTSLMKRAKLRRIVLCRDLSFAGQLRTAIPDFEHDDLYLDVSRG